MERPFQEFKVLRLHCHNNVKTIGDLYSTMSSFQVERKRGFDTMISTRTAFYKRQEEQVLEAKFSLKSREAELKEVSQQTTELEFQLSNVYGELNELKNTLYSLKDTYRSNSIDFYKIFDLIKVRNFEEMLEFVEEREKVNNTTALRFREANRLFMLEEQELTELEYLVESTAKQVLSRVKAEVLENDLTGVQRENNQRLLSVLNEKEKFFSRMTERVNILFSQLEREFRGKRKQAPKHQLEIKNYHFDSEIRVDTIKTKEEFTRLMTKLDLSCFKLNYLYFHTILPHVRNKKKKISVGYTSAIKLFKHLLVNSKQTRQRHKKSVIDYQKFLLSEGSRLEEPISTKRVVDTVEEESDSFEKTPKPSKKSVSKMSKTVRAKDNLFSMKLKFAKSNNFMSSVEGFRREYSRVKQRAQLLKSGRKQEEMFICEQTQPKMSRNKRQIGGLAMRISRDSHIKQGRCLNKQENYQN